MVNISGSVQRSFLFPADIDTALNYYSNLHRTFSFIDHISIMHHHGDEEYRMVYHATELGIYRVRIFCDIRAEVDCHQSELRVHSLDHYPPMSSKAGIYSLSSQGSYNSRSIFKANGDQTEIKYDLQLNASLPIPIGLRFMPEQVIGQIANNITQWRITQIAENFIDRSLRAFNQTKSM